MISAAMVFEVGGALLALDPGVGGGPLELGPEVVPAAPGRMPVSVQRSEAYVGCIQE